VNVIWAATSRFLSGPTILDFGLGLTQYNKTGL